MWFSDVNVLLNAFIPRLEFHELIAPWLENAVNSDEQFGVSELVLSAFVRIVTQPRFPGGPSPMSIALGFAEQMRAAPNVVTLAPGPRHWSIFRRLCEGPSIHGNLVADAYIAALAIEHGAELVSLDADFARFPGLRWRHPLRPA
jgi:toxin-antitoxin system PIN domain toxin